jgi:hypothetical protein
LWVLVVWKKSQCKNPLFQEPQRTNGFLGDYLIFFIWTVINYWTKKDMDESHNKDEYDKLVKSIVDIYQNSPNEVW